MNMIAPLKWLNVNSSRETANTPFGSYFVEEEDGKFRWGYCFDEYYDEDNFSCDDIEDGKAKAWAHWLGRLEDVFVANGKEYVFDATLCASVIVIAASEAEARKLAKEALATAELKLTLHECPVSIGVSVEGELDLVE